MRDYDPYEYWEDLKYLSDGGFQEEGQLKKRRKQPVTKTLSTATNKKRKSTAQDGSKQRKRQRTRRDQTKQENVKENGEDVVVWLTTRDQTALLAEPVLKEGSSVPVIITSNHAMQQAPSTLQTSKMDERHDSAIVADGFDLNNISSVAGLLSSEHIDTLKAILEAQGLDPEALDVVLKDLIEGRDPDFEEEQEVGGDATHGRNGG